MSSAQVFRDVSLGGSSVSLSLPAGAGSAQKRLADLASLGPIPSISSVKLSSDPDAETSLYLFSGISPIAYNDNRRMIPYTTLRLTGLVGPWQDFHGRFVRLTIPGGAPPLTINDLSTHTFSPSTGNFKPASCLLVNRSKNTVYEETISAKMFIKFFWDLFLGNTSVPGLIPIIEVLQPGMAIAKIKDPVFTWLPFPKRPNFSSSEVYFVASQQFIINVWGIGTNVWLMFYFRFSVKNNRLNLEIIDMDRYVMPSLIGGNVEMAIDNAKTEILSNLRLVLPVVMKFLPSNCDDVYLLPGTQPTLRATGHEIAVDDALDDVTIVLVNPRAASWDLLTGLPTRVDTVPLTAHPGIRLDAPVPLVATLATPPAAPSLAAVAPTRHQRDSPPLAVASTPLDSLPLAASLATPLDSPSFVADLSTRRQPDPPPLVADSREVISVFRTSRGVTTHLSGERGSRWSPIGVADAIEGIQTGTARYFTRVGDRVAFLAVVQDTGEGAYLQATPGGLPENDLENLPLSGGDPPPA